MKIFLLVAIMSIDDYRNEYVIERHLTLDECNTLISQIEVVEDGVKTRLVCSYERFYK